jgi:hypothetical protein
MHDHSILEYSRGRWPARHRRHAAAAGIGAGAGVAETQARPALVQRVASKYNRRYYRDDGTYVRAPFAEVDTRGGTWVAAPFARVYSGRRGTWVRAPFVDRWVPR